mmetsp:Transcript_8807/g.21393  ORF Transcript_8807/g.21393 Transcript_8807/m.21393 type:complete len:309 (+) Transcript_8807:219-1145(+)|eukprot:CAMPEP_0181104928 /NCGR_PEP_ID=MMETSP1071-20121207/15694_1 /TAXON_ID=35127 /ORGANISM="Thalassiosira sp., Strain NH16" /LENGTH=308 /DNA_ID=CAMNT_0023188169 /DNA_START=155 /DNA_END=1081 /DNA_ORIENTATION=-
MPGPSILPLHERDHPLDARFSYLSISYHDSLSFVTVVALNRPKKRNAINAQMWKEIGDAFRQLGTTGDGCRCVLLTGSGKGFCGGIDITDEKFFSGISGGGDADKHGPSRDMARQSLAFRSQILEMQAAFTAVGECPVPVVAAIHGACVGAGIDLTCCADVRVCSPNAMFSIREVRLGLAADVGTLQRFPKIVGFGSLVRELCLTGDDFNAEDALKIGFVSRISRTNDDLANTANSICQRISRNSPVAATVTKASLNYSRDHTIAEGLEHVALHNSTALMSEDLVKSFLMSRGAADAQFAPLQSHSRL